MSTLPPCSRGGTVRAPSLATRSKSEPLKVPRIALLASGGRASGGTRSGFVSMRACSRRFPSGRRQGEGGHPVGVRVYESLLSAVPLGQQLGRGSAADEARVLYPYEPDVRYVTRGCMNSSQVPDRLVRVRVVVREETTAVLPGEDT